MALNPFFSLSALSPSVITYGAVLNPTIDPWASAWLYSYGGITGYYTPYSLQNQCDNDEIIIGFNPVDPTDENDITDYQAEILRRSVIKIFFRTRNVTLTQQFLLIFGLHKLYPNTSAQFFVGTDFVRTEPLVADEEQVALLIDVPGDNAWMSVHVRLASTTFYHAMGFRGVDVYLI